MLQTRDRERERKNECASASIFKHQCLNIPSATILGICTPFRSPYNMQGQKNALLRANHWRTVWLFGFPNMDIFCDLCQSPPCVKQWICTTIKGHDHSFNPNNALKGGITQNICTQKLYSAGTVFIEWCFVSSLVSRRFQISQRHLTTPPDDAPAWPARNFKYSCRVQWQFFLDVPSTHLWLHSNSATRAQNKSTFDWVHMLPLTLRPSHWIHVYIIIYLSYPTCFQAFWRKLKSCNRVWANIPIQKLVWHLCTYLPQILPFLPVPGKLGQMFNQTSRKILWNTTRWDGRGMTWALELRTTYQLQLSRRLMPNVHNQSVTVIRLPERKSIWNSKRKWNWKPTQNSKIVDLHKPVAV